MAPQFLSSPDIRELIICLMAGDPDDHARIANAARAD
jgi:hypothetical protein